MENANVDLSEDQIAKVLQGITIPPQPQIMVDLQMEQVQPDPDIDRIADLIAQDAGLAGTVLKIVNSPLFAITSNITSVRQGVMLLGYNSVINIVNGISIKSELSDEAILALNRFWDSAMDIAMVATSIAKQIGFANPDDAYSMGLFHNVGIPMMFQRFPNYFDIVEKSYTGDYKRVIDAENEAFQTNHAVVGYYTAKSWRISKDICQVIADHHNIPKNLDSAHHSEQTTLLVILKMAEHICGNYAVLGKQAKDVEWEQMREDIFSYTGIGQYDLDNMIETFRDMGIGNLDNYY